MVAHTGSQPDGAVERTLTELLHILRIENGVHLLTEPDPGFEQVYLEVRKREGWLVTDEALRTLPNPQVNDPHAAIWKIRRQSLHCFVDYIRGLSRPPRHVLEIGCGNGWFSHALAVSMPGAQVFALDINLFELQQAAQVFGDANPIWLYGDVFAAKLPERFFKIIVFNGSLQYFPDISALFDRLLPSLVQQGEIHILDSPFYPAKHVQEAMKRTEAYYAQLGVKSMVSYYHAHSIEALATYHPDFLHKPSSFTNRLRRLSGQTVNPLPWIRLRP